MEDIINMENSMLSINDLFSVQIGYNIQISSIWYICEYPFLKIDDYKTSVIDYTIKNNSPELKMLLEKHFKFCAKIEENYNKVQSVRNNCIDLINSGRLEEHKKYLDSMIKINGKDSTYVGLDLYCRFTKSKNECQFVEGDNPLSKPCLFNPFNTPYKITFNATLANDIKRIHDFLYDRMRYFNILSPISENKITIPDNILNELQKTTNKIGSCKVKQMIDNIAVRPLKWLATKQDLRELLTHEKIKGKLTVTEVERQTPNLFVDKDDNPIKLAKNKSNNSIETDFIKKILATL
jgi:hypothetical protein